MQDTGSTVKDSRDGANVFSMNNFGYIQHMYSSRWSVTMWENLQWCFCSQSIR